ncbi:MAG: P22 phage major capsid protein family protein [Cyanobacteria bacterium P01_F01_bin.13]
MPNDVTGLTPLAEIRTLEVLRETVAMSQIVTNNTENMDVPVERGETVDINVMNRFTTRAVVPGVTPPATGENDVEPVTSRLTLDRHEESSFVLTNREWLAIAAGKSEAYDEAIRAVANAINDSLTGLYVHVGRNVGTPGTTPFTANTQLLKDANVWLSQQAAPKSRRSLILDPFAYGEATQLPALQRVDQGGDPETLRDAMITRAVGYDWAEDQQVRTHTSVAAGTYAVDATAVAGARTIIVDDGAGALPAAPLTPGDPFTIAGSTTQHSVVSYTPNATDATVVISPGLEADVVDGAVLTVNAAAHVANMAFHPQAFHLAVRPEDQVNLSILGESRSNKLIRRVVDEMSGVALTVCIYEEFHQTRLEVSALWGVVAARPELAVRIMG